MLYSWIGKRKEIYPSHEVESINLELDLKVLVLGFLIFWIITVLVKHGI